MAVVFVNKLENGNKISEGLCIKCAKELGIPVDNMLGNMMSQMGISPEQLENMEDDINSFINENLPCGAKLGNAVLCTKMFFCSRRKLG